MGVQVKEIRQASLAAPKYEGRRPDRVYEDQIWKWCKANPGKSPWKDPANPPKGESDFRP